MQGDRWAYVLCVQKDGEDKDINSVFMSWPRVKLFCQGAFRRDLNPARTDDGQIKENSWEIKLPGLHVTVVKFLMG